VWLPNRDQMFLICNPNRTKWIGQHNGHRPRTAALCFSISLTTISAKLTSRLHCAASNVRGTVSMAHLNPGERQGGNEGAAIPKAAPRAQLQSLRI
jgi:hypothetical protein